MPDPIDLTNGTVPPWLKWIIQLGVPAAIALFLVYMNAVNNRADMHDLRQEFHSAIEDPDTGLIARVKAHADATGQIFRELQEQNISSNVLVQIAKANCLHQAKTTDERRECYEASKR